MDGRYIIYKGFREDAIGIFKPLIQAFNLTVSYLEDSGIILENNHSALIVEYETGLQYKFMDVQSREIFFLSDMFKKKGINSKWVSKEGDTSQEKVNAIKELNEFLIKNFSGEFRGQYWYREDLINQVKKRDYLIGQVWFLDINDPVYVKFKNNDESFLDDLEKKLISQGKFPNDYI